MSAQILDGRKVANQLMEKYQKMVGQLIKRNVQPRLLVFTTSDDPAGLAYSRAQEKAANDLGIIYEGVLLDESTRLEDLLTDIDKVNLDPNITAIIIQAPLPSHLESSVLLNRVDPIKDVEGLHAYNLGKLVTDKSELEPSTARGVIRLLQAHDIQIEGQAVTILGMSKIVGMPLAIMLSHLDATVSLCHIKTPHLRDYIKDADILVSAMGNPHVIQAQDIKDQAVVVDVAMNQNEDGKFVGDVPYHQILDKVSAITPVPGGVGPMTVAMTMEQVIQCACLQHNLDFNDLLSEEDEIGRPREKKLFNSNSTHSLH